MANPEHVEILKQGVEVWNKWREDNPEIRPDLEDIDIKKICEESGSSFEINDDIYNLQNINFTGCNLRKTQIAGLDCSGALFCQSNLNISNFNGSNLFQADFSHAKGSRCLFRKAEMMEAIFNDTILIHSKFEGASMSNASIIKSNWASSILDEAELVDSNLTDSNFSGCVITNAKLMGANLNNVDLSDAKLKNSYLNLANLVGAKLLRASFENAYASGVLFSRSSRQQCYKGIEISNCRGSQIFKSFAQDQDFIEELRDSGKWGEKIFWIWWLFADCGRSFLRWAGWSLLFALSFAVLFFFIIGPDSFRFAGPPADSFQTMIYYSVVTFTTLGFGDVTPVTKGAMWAVMAEVVLGYIMLGGLISILANKLARRS